MANAWIQKFWSQLMDFHFFGCTFPELLAFCSETACSIMVMSIEGCFPFSVEFECVQPVIEESQQKQCGSNFTILMLMYFFKTKGIGHVFVLLLLSNLMWCCRVWRTLWEAELEWNYFLLIYTEINASHTQGALYEKVTFNWFCALESLRALLWETWGNAWNLCCLFEIC